MKWWVAASRLRRVKVRQCLKATCGSNAEIRDTDHRKVTCTIGQTRSRTGGRSLSDTSRVLSFEEGLLGSKARNRLGLALAPSMVNHGCITVAGRVIGRELLQIGTVPNKRKRGSVEPANGVAPPRPTEHAMLEAAIQMDLITPEQAESLVENGKTLGEWLVEQEKGEAGKARKVKLRMLDALGVLALLLFNLVVLVGFGWIVLRVLRSL